MGFKRFEDIEAWQLARDLCKKLYTLSQNSSLGKDFKLWNQLNGSSGSIMDNIAEGNGRNGNKEFIQFLSIAKASASESKSQLYRAFDRSYFDEETFNQLIVEVDLIERKLGALIQYLIKSDYKGNKYK